jgi:metal-responsive CopG/Arc/MetJ family transcriptional regulator
MYIANMEEERILKNIGLQLDTDMIKEIKKQAKEEERSMSSFIRLAIKKYLESEKK